MAVINDNNCGWLINISKKKFFKRITDNLECKYLVIDFL